MVCSKCEKKLSKVKILPVKDFHPRITLFDLVSCFQVIVPDKWKEGASNVTEGGGRKVNENKLLSKKQR